MGGHPNPFAAARLSPVSYAAGARELPWFWKAHESERYYECATPHYAAVQVRRRSVPKTAAAARGDQRETRRQSQEMRPDVLQPRDHQAVLPYQPLGVTGGGIAQFFLEEGWFARVTDPAIMYSYLLHRQPKSSNLIKSSDDLHA